MENMLNGSNDTALNDLGTGSENSLPEWTYTFQIVFMVTIATIGIPCNILLVVVQFKNVAKSSTDYLVLTMAIFDLICSSVNTTFYVLRNLNFVRKHIASEGFCRTHHFTMTVTNIACILLLTAIALDRYFKTCRPFSVLFSKSHTKRICIFIASISFICSVPVIGISAYDVKLATCSQIVFPGIALHILQATVFAILFVVVVVSYTKITTALRNRYKEKVVARFFHTSRTDGSVTFTHIRGSPGMQRSNTVEPETTVKLLHEKSTQSNTTKSNVNSALTLPINGDIQAIPNVSVCVKHESEIDNNAKDKSSPQRSFIPDLKGIQTENIGDCETSRNDKTTQTHIHTSEVRHSERIKDANMYDNIEQAGPSSCINIERIQDVTNNEMNDVEQISHHRLFKEKQKLNRITLIMFLVTAVYMLSWLTYWLACSLSAPDTASGRIIIQLANTSFMINSITTPVFYICMSSLFRKNARQLVCS